MESFGRTFPFSVQRLFKVVDTKTDSGSTDSFQGWIYVTIPMRKPAVQRFQELLTLRGSENLKFLCGFNWHIVVHHLSLETRLGWALVHVVVDGCHKIGGISPENTQFLGRTFLRDITT